MDVRLTVDGDASTRRIYVFSGPTSVIAGRADDCDVRVPDDDRGVSRRHCRFDIDPPEVRVSDLGSANGTYVNGVRTGGRVLADGDEVRIGTTRMTLSAPPVCPGYEIGRLLGRGAQGAVYLARREDDGEQVAVKVLTTETGVGEAAKQAFLREMENVRALRHPNVVAFRGGRVVGEALFLVCEFCAGGSLDHRVAGRGGRLAVADAVGITVQVLDALAYAHDAVIPEVRLADGSVVPGRGLVHRDVKPQNVLLAAADGPPVVKLADFGLAKAFDSAGLSGLTWTGAVGGSVGFMPREQVVNYKFARPGVDVWAATALLYWMLTGATPRDFPAGADPVSVVLREAAVPVRDREPSVPAGLSAVLDDVLRDESLTAVPSASELKGVLSGSL